MIVAPVQRVLWIDTMRDGLRLALLMCQGVGGVVSVDRILFLSDHILIIIVLPLIWLFVLIASLHIVIVVGTVIILLGLSLITIPLVIVIGICVGKVLVRKRRRE